MLDVRWLVWLLIIMSLDPRFHNIVADVGVSSADAEAAAAVMMISSAAEL